MKEPKIIYTDEEDMLENSEPESPITPIIRTRPSIIGFFAIVLLIGALGGVAGTIVAAQNPTIRRNLGFSESSGIAPAKTEKVVVEESSAVIDATNKISPAVVSISTKSNVVDFFGQVMSQVGGGSGFIITADGLIVTNKHVVSNANATYTVFTSDGKSYPATIVASDPVQDLAVIKIQASGLPVVDLGDSDKLQVGQHVIAIGNALGQFQNTVTLGVISAKERQIAAGDAVGGSTENLEGLLQTDAAINEGNSGGPLVNLKGQVIGINTAVAAKGTAEGLGFAIPINTVIKSIDQVEKLGKITRAYLGVRYISLTKEIADQNNLSVTNGAYIVGDQQSPAIVSGSPAEKAGLKTGDVITAINGTNITQQKSLASIMNNFNVGDSITITLIRDKKEMSVKATLEELK